LVVERLPADAPDLNSVEALWGNLEGTELANLCVDTISETEYHARPSVPTSCEEVCADKLIN